MPVKKYTVQDGVFVHEHTTASIKNTPTKKFEEGLKRSLEESGRRNTTAYILEHLEKYARARLEAPSIERKKGQRLNNFQRELEADKRQRRDCESLLQEIDFLKTISRRKDTNQDFLLSQFYCLGVLAQQADIRSVEPAAFQGIAESQINTEKARKTRTRNGMTPAERDERDEIIRADFAKSKVSLESFAKHHAKKDPYKKGNGESLSAPGIKYVIKKGHEKRQPSS